MKSGRGLFLESEYAATATVDTVAVTAATGADNAEAFRFVKNNIYENSATLTNMGLTVVNSTATFNGTSVDTTGFTFVVPLDTVPPALLTQDPRKITIDATASIGNKTNAASAAVYTTDKVVGTITVGGL